MKKLNKLKIAGMLLCTCASLALVSCSNPKQALGLNKKAPDEFAVVKRAPLEMPSDYEQLPAPRPGASRPQEQSPVIEARETIFGETSKKDRGLSEGEAALLNQTAAGEAEPEIRRIVDEEAVKHAEKDRPVADRLLNWASSSPKDVRASVVDPEKEAERLKENLEAGKPVTAGDTPSVER